MSDDEADEELLELLRASLGMGPKNPSSLPAETKVLRDAEYIYDNAIDVAISSSGAMAAASQIWSLMQERSYSPKTWTEHELHPQTKDEGTVNFIFAMDLLNYSFWPDSPGDEHFAVEYRSKYYTGYWSLVAALQRALEEGLPVTDPHFWGDENEATDQVWEHVFRSSNGTVMPLLEKRVACLRHAAKVLYEEFECSVVVCIERAGGSAAALVNLLVEHFEVFRDEGVFDGVKVRFYKRAQIFAADLWACFEGKSYGAFHDIDKITMFADYRIPQMLRNLGCLQYSPPLEAHVRQHKPIESGHSWELQLRGCSIWCVELIRRQILRLHPKAEVNAVLIDFFLYDFVKEEEETINDTTPHHRTRCIWY